MTTKEKGQYHRQFGGIQVLGGSQCGLYKPNKLLNQRFFKRSFLKHLFKPQYQTISYENVGFIVTNVNECFEEDLNKKP